MQITKCDRCGKVNNNVLGHGWSTIETRTEDEIDYGLPICAVRHICDECFHEFYLWLMEAKCKSVSATDAK